MSSFIHSSRYVFPTFKIFVPTHSEKIKILCNKYGKVVYPKNKMKRPQPNPFLLYLYI